MKPKVLTVFFAVMFITSIFAQQSTIPVQDKFGNKLQVLFNLKTASAHRVYGSLPTIKHYGFQSKNLDRTSIENLSNQLFSDYNSILKINPAQMKHIKTETDGNMWFVSYQQAVDGIPVYGTEIGYTINQNGDIVSLGADAYSNINITTTPILSKMEALAKAQIAFSVDSAKVTNNGELTIYPIFNGVNVKHYLAWKVVLFSFKPLKDITYFVDANNGEIIEAFDNFMGSSPIVGKGY